MSQSTLETQQEERTGSLTGVPAEGARIPVTFHPASSVHYRAIANLLPNRWDLYCAHPTGTYPLTVKQVSKLVQKRLEPTVMMAGGIVLGFACFYRYRPEHSIFVGNVMIQLQVRTQGLGRQIMVRMVELAFGKYNVPQVRVSIASDNTASLLGCVQGGFRPYAVRERQDHNGKPVAWVHLRLDRMRYGATPVAASTRVPVA